MHFAFTRFATGRSLALVFVIGGVAAFVGCGTSNNTNPTPTADTDAGTPDASIVLPPTLETCGTTAPPDDAAPFTGAFQVSVPTVHLGDGVRNDALVGTPGSQIAFEQATSAEYMTNGASTTLFDDTANPLVAYTGDPKSYDYTQHTDAITDPLPINALEAYGQVTGAHAFTTKDFERWVHADFKLDIAWRGSYQVLGDVATGKNFTSTGQPKMAGDAYLFGIFSAWIIDIDVRIRPAGDAACHIRNMKRILTAGGDLPPDADSKYLDFETLSDASVIAYIQRYNVKGTTHALSLGTSADDPFAGTTPCDLAQPDKCKPWRDAIIAKAHTFKQGDGPTADDLFQGKVPKGWIILGGLQDAVP